MRQRIATINGTRIYIEDSLHMSVSLYKEYGQGEEQSTWIDSFNPSQAHVLAAILDSLAVFIENRKK